MSDFKSLLSFHALEGAPITGLVSAIAGRGEARVLDVSGNEKKIEQRKTQTWGSRNLEQGSNSLFLAGNLLK